MKKPDFKRLIALLNKLDARDIHAYAGIILVAIGANLIYPPAGYITAGAILLFIAFRR